MCAHAGGYWFGRTEGIGRVPMQTVIGLAELKALGVCPCSIYCAVLGPNGRRRAGPSRRHQEAGAQGRAGGGASRRGVGGAAWGRRERRDGHCARRGVAPFSPTSPGQSYPVRPVESVPGTQTLDTPSHTLYHLTGLYHLTSLRTFPPQPPSLPHGRPRGAAAGWGL